MKAATRSGSHVGANRTQLLLPPPVQRSMAPTNPPSARRHEPNPEQSGKAGGRPSARSCPGSRLAWARDSSPGSGCAAGRTVTSPSRAPRGAWCGCLTVVPAGCGRRGGGGGRGVAVSYQRSGARVAVLGLSGPGPPVSSGDSGPSRGGGVQGGRGSGSGSGGLCRCVCRSVRVLVSWQGRSQRPSVLP